MVRIAKRNYYYEIFSGCNNDMNGAQKNINKILSELKSQTEISLTLSRLINVSCHLIERCNIAEAVNKFFVNLESS